MIYPSFKTCNRLVSELSPYSNHNEVRSLAADYPIPHIFTIPEFQISAIYAFPHILGSGYILFIRQYRALRDFPQFDYIAVKPRLDDYIT